MNEEPLAGGNVTPVVRVSDTVRRTAGPWTPTIHRLLSHLRASGLGWVPAAHGMDDDGREIVDYLPGFVPTYPMPDWIWSDAVLTDAARKLRALHDSTASFDSAEAIWRLPPHEPAEVICHNDFAPYNLVFTDRTVTGVIDFDTASPGPRIWDVAYLAHRLVPLNERDRADDSPVERLRRLVLVLDAYGAEFTAAQTIIATADRLRELADFSQQQSRLQGRRDLAEHAALYRADAAALESGTIIRTDRSR
jgi:aminoglycoside phosphotransferase (APT) family kinase protein